LYARVRILHSEFEGPLGTPKPHGSDAQPSSIQSGKHLVEPISPFTQEIHLRHDTIVEE
jgi:hypothetical protein